MPKLTSEPFEDLRGGHFQPLEYHRRLLNDANRMDAYERAIRALVRPGDVVLDLGCGIGILAMLAARRGAVKVHAVESTPIAHVAKSIVKANHLEKVVTVHHQDIREMDVVESVDLIVSDFIGRFLIDDFMIDAVIASEEWLKPGARFCPSRITLCLTPVGGFELAPVDFFDHTAYGLSFDKARKYSLNMCYHTSLSSTVAMGDDVVFTEYVPPNEAPDFDETMRFEITRPDRIIGLAGWFVADLAPSVQLSTRIGIDTHWGQYLFPLPPLQVEVGDWIDCHLWLERFSGNAIWHWSGAVSRQGKNIDSFDLESAQRLGERESD